MSGASIAASWSQMPNKRRLGAAPCLSTIAWDQAVMLPKITPLRKTWPGGGPQYPPPHPTRIQEIVLWKPAGRATISTAAAPLHAIVATWNPVLQNLSPEELLCIGAACLKQGAPKPNARLVHPGAKLGPRRNRLSPTCFQGPSAEAVM